ncbi:MAG: cache domain-containing protein [Candidatus Heimdallarchaeota archaeon]
MGLKKFIQSRSIRTNIMVSFVLLSLLFIGGTGGLSYLLFKRAGQETISDSTSALEKQITENIKITAEKNAEIIFQKLSNAESMVRYEASNLEYLFSDENRFGPRDTYYDYWFEYNLSNTPADTHYDPSYGIQVSYDYASYYFEGSNSTHYLPQNSLQNKTLNTVAAMDYVFKEIHNNAPEFRWLYIAFELAGIDLFINYPGSVLLGDDAERNDEPYEPHLEPWYIDVKSGDGRIVFTEPYFDEFDGVPLITIGRVAKFSNGTDIGVICGDISIEDMVNKIVNITILETGYAALINSDGLVVAHPESAPSIADPNFPYINEVEVNSDDTSALNATALSLITSGGSGIIKYTRNGQERFLAYQPVGKGDYISLIILPVDEALAGIEPVVTRMNNGIRTNQNTIWIIVASSFVIGITVGLILTAYITRPFTHLIQVARSLSTRRARKDIEQGLMMKIDQRLLESNDELGELTRAFKGMLESVQEAEREKNH